MRKFILLLFCALVLFSSCGDDLTKIKQRKIIKREKFVDILIDMHLMDAITSSPELFRLYTDNDSLDLYSGIFDKYGVTQALFDSTVSAYTRQPEIYKEIYDEVLLKLNMRLNDLRDAEKNEQDSINAKGFEQ